MFDPTSIQRLARETNPDRGVRRRLRTRMMRTIGAEDGLAMSAAASRADLSAERKASLKASILNRLHVRKAPWASSFIKWTAAFAMFVLLVRSLPLVLLAPVLQAETGVQLVTSGDVHVTVAGIDAILSATTFLRGPMTIRTGDSQATIIFNDDGVVRLDSNTEIRLHDIGDRPHFASMRPTLELKSGRLWALGLLPPSFTPISVGTSKGIASVNAGSISVEDDGKRVEVAAYDRGANFHSPNQDTLLVAGEQMVATARGLTPGKISVRQFDDPWVSVNQDMDAVHRVEITQLQQERREKSAGILPTSSLYLAKRLAEKVDIVFTFDGDSRIEKQVRQADTRLNEALTLIGEGQQDEAQAPLNEYRQALASVAGSGDSGAKFLLQRQIAEVTSSITVASASDLGDGQQQELQQTVLDLSAAIPDAVQSPDIKGYVLVDKLIELNQSLRLSQSITGALVSYESIKPELTELLKENGAHPLLKKEATALLADLEKKVKELTPQDAGNPTIIAMQKDLAQYLPPEEEKKNLLAFEAGLDAEVDAMVKRIFNIGANGEIGFKSPRSRYNQLMNEMANMRINKDPNRGTKLRRLYRKLPEGLAGYVKTEIKEMGDELNGGNEGL